MLIFERSSLLGRALFGFLGGLAGLGGFLAGSWRVLGGRKYAPENGFRGVEGLAFERGGGGWMLGHAWGSGAWGGGGWTLGRLGLGVACYLSFCRLVLYAKPTTFAIVKPKSVIRKSFLSFSNDRH